MKNSKSKRVLFHSLLIVAISMSFFLLTSCQKEKERGCDSDGKCEPLYGEDKDNCDDCK